MHVQWSADSRRYMQSESPDKKRNKKKEKERQYCARRERSDESVRETGQIESSRRDAYSIRVRTKESPPLSPTVSFFFLHRQSSSSALLDYALGTERSPRHGHLLSIYFFCVVLFPCIDDTADLFISNEIRSYSVAEYDHHRHHLCGDIFSSSSSAIQSNDVADQQRERESSALDLILLSGAQLFNTSIITTMSESLYIVRVHSS